jgi:hypothetical protein
MREYRSGNDDLIVLVYMPIDRDRYIDRKKAVCEALDFFGSNGAAALVALRARSGDPRSLLLPRRALNRLPVRCLKTPVAPVTTATLSERSKILRVSFVRGILAIGLGSPSWSGVCVLGSLSTDREMRLN